MKRFYSLVLAAILIPAKHHCQSAQADILLLHGVNRSFVPSTKIGHSSSIGLSFKFRNKRSPLFLEPSVSFSKNTFVKEPNPQITAKIRQRFFDLTAVAGMDLSKYFRVHAGFFVTKTFAESLIFVSHNGGYSSVGQSTSFDGYHPAPLQVGLTAGLAFLAGERLSFIIRVRQFVTPVINEDHRFVLNGVQWLPDVIFNKKMIPTVLLFGLDFKIMCKKKDKAASHDD